VETHSNTALREGERARAARHTAADHRHLGTSGNPAPRQLAASLCEPV
jgi:hypothetical protein